MTSTSRTAVLNTDTTCITGSGKGGIVPPGVYLIAEIDGAEQHGSLFIEVAGELAGALGPLVEISQRSAGLRIAYDTTPFVNPDVPAELTAGFVAGTCGHAVAGSEWLAGMRTCERCG